MSLRFESLCICLVLVASSVVSLDCGDSLSSLDSIRRSSRDVYHMTLSPDFGRCGKTVEVVVMEFDAALEKLLANAIAYPAEISFGDGTFIKSFGTNSDDKLKIDVFVSPLAKEGERQPSMVFSIDDRQVEVRGRFWVLPAIPE